MALSDSTFLLHKVIIDVLLFNGCKRFSFKVTFAGFLEVPIKDINGYNFGARRKISSKRNKKSREIEHNVPKKYIALVILPKRAVAILCITKRHFLSLWSKVIPGYTIGTIIWRVEYFKDYPLKDTETSAVGVNHDHTLQREINYKSIETVNIFLKVICLATNDYRVKCFSMLALNNIVSLNEIDIKKKYNGKIKRNTNNNKKEYSTETNDCLFNTSFETKENVTKFLNGIISSNFFTVIANNSNQNDFLSERSMKECKRYNALNYIFGDPTMSFKNRVYCVNYFTVDTNISNAATLKSPDSGTNPEQSPKKERSKVYFKKCSSGCISKSCSSLSLDVPPEISSLIRIKQCKEIVCNSRKHRKLPEPKNNAIRLDLSSLKTKCCSIGALNQTVEKVEFEDSCFCTCECQFEFMKKTTFCKICGGYEVLNEDFFNKPAHELPIPCPIFHKLTEKSKLKALSTSGSESRKRGEESQKSPIKVGSSQKASSDKRLGLSDKKSVESEKDAKKGKKKKDDRFKFNYGYKAPQIGHSQCAMPCTGTIENVPKNMGWLWTAEDIPGMKVSLGWKPGAVSKYLHRKLKAAKLRTSTVENAAVSRRTKKRNENKPTLIINKLNGKYRVEMQIVPKNLDDTNTHYTPLLYQIENCAKSRINEKLKLNGRLSENTTRELDSKSSESCVDSCLRTYYNRIDLTSNKIKNIEHNIVDDKTDIDDVSSEGSSDINWEIHFSPPITKYYSRKK